MKKIKKECFKNMIAGPCLVEPQLKYAKQNFQKDSNSICSSGFPKHHKNSTCGPTYNSDTEDNKQSESTRVRDEVNREAKHWHQ